MRIENFLSDFEEAPGKVTSNFGKCGQKEV
jgi:hypothetical protein